MVQIGSFVIIASEGLESLIAGLGAAGYQIVGPVVRDGAIVFGSVSTADDLPRGWHDIQAPGHYQLVDAGDDEVFGWAVGPASAKAHNFPSRSLIWRSDRSDSDALVEAGEDTAVKVAFLGLRPCDLAALRVLDRVFLGGSLPDQAYARRRRDQFLVAIECGHPSASCFCASMSTGPGVDLDDATPQADLVITELEGAGGHRLLVRAGTEQGANLLDRIEHRDATPEDLAARTVVLEASRRSMERGMDADGVADLLAANVDHPHWDALAERCLACGNCTLVCPTCFCSTFEQTTNLAGEARMDRRWSSCFELDHSRLTSGPVRASVKSRYRQWLTHKLSGWVDQFGTSGCVGCGRCITWCPVGIDLTAAVAAIAGDAPESSAAP